MDYVHGMVHYMDDHIHVVLCHTVEYSFVQLFGMDLNDMHVGMYELRMKWVYHRVDHIKLLLNDKESKREEIFHLTKFNQI
jgi:hypothetical protein